MPARTARLPNLLLALASASLALAAGECLLALNAPGYPDEKAHTSEVTLNGTPYRLFERREAIERPQGAVLIAGDSFTAGAPCADGRTYPSAFTRAARSRGAGVHAVNLGRRGTGPISYALTLRDYLAAKGTAAGLIVTLYANDVEIDCEACGALSLWWHLGGLGAADREALAELCARCPGTAQRRPAGPIGPWREAHWRLSGLHTYRLLREAVARLPAGIRPGVEWGRGSYPRRWRLHEGIDFRHVRAGLELAAQQASTRGLPVMAVIFPHPVGMEPHNEDVAIYEEAAAALARSTGVPVHSGYEAFLANPRARPDMPFSRTDPHPACEANEIFGQWVFERWRRLTAAAGS